LKVKASKDFEYYRLAVLKVPVKDKVNVYECELSVEDFRALQDGKAVDIDKKLYDMYKNVFEVVKTSKEVK
jgi:hypothetical protein